MKSIDFPLTNLMIVIIGFCFLITMGANATAQLSDLRQSRQPLPGISDLTHVGISVTFGSAPHLINSKVIGKTLQSQLETLGYRVSLTSTTSHDRLRINVDCEAIEEKNGSRFRNNPIRSSGNVSTLTPPCQLTYLYQQEEIPWKNVDRLIYSESVSTMKEIAKISPPLKPQECVEQFFRLYDVPVLVAAEWGHIDRLLQALDHQNTSVSRQRLILTLLGETRVPRGYSVLVEHLKDVNVAREAAKALGFFGLRAQKYLIPIVQDRSDPQLQAAAAKGLGRIAAATGNSQQTPLYMQLVVDPTIDIHVRTQLVWALGKAPDMRAYSTLLQIEQHIWDEYSHDPSLKEFREALDWSIREVKQGGHGDDF